MQERTTTAGVHKSTRGTDIWAAWEKFCERHGGAIPGWLAAEYLKMSPGGVTQAANRGWLAFFSHGRNRHYSRADLIRYRWNVSRKFRDVRPLPPYPPVLDKPPAGENPPPL